MNKVRAFTKKFLREEYLKKKRSSVEIGKELGCCNQTIINQLRSFNLNIRNPSEYLRKYIPLDLEPIKTMSSPDYAYFIGFIAADGCVCYDKTSNSDRLIIQLSKKDEQILTDFKRVLNIENPIQHRKYKTGDQVRLELKQPLLLETFKVWNVVPKKSHIMRFPINIPRKMFGHYLRGLFDGDGCITFAKNNHTLSSVRLRIYSGSQYYASGLAKELKNYGIIINNTYKLKTERCWSVEISTKSFLDLYKLMYSTKNLLCLKRKKDRFDLWSKHLQDLEKRIQIKTLNPNAKLNWEQITRIKYLYNHRYTQKELSKLFKVSKSCVSSILRGETYVK